MQWKKTNTTYSGGPLAFFFPFAFVDFAALALFESRDMQKSALMPSKYLR